MTDINKSFFDFEVTKSESISKIGEMIHQCLIKKDDELKDILIRRGRWELMSKKNKDDLYRRTPINICLSRLLKEKKSTEIAIVGTMCSGKSTFWEIYNPEQNKELVKHIADIGKDEEGYRNHMSPTLNRYYTTHDHLRISDEFNENDGVIVIDRDIDDKVDCFIKDRPQWKESFTSKTEVKESLINDKNKMNDILKKTKTNIFRLKWKDNEE